MRLRRMWVLASVGLAAVFAVVPRTAAGTPVLTRLTAAVSPAAQSAVSPFPLDPFAKHAASQPVDDSRIFEARANRGGGRSTDTTAAPTTTSTTVTTRPITVRPARTTATTTSQPRPTTTTTAAPVVAASQWSPPPDGCMANTAKSYAQMQSCWGGLVGQYPWPSVAKVWSVMYCESKGNPWAHNPSGANGLMQEMGGPYDPAANIARAWSQSNHGTNWSPWVCR